MEEEHSLHQAEPLTTRSYCDQTQPDYTTDGADHDEDDDHGDDADERDAGTIDEDNSVEEFKCSLCESEFNSERDLVAHKRSAHMRRWTGGSKPCACPICKKTFKNKPSLSAHVSIQHRKRVLFAFSKPFFFSHTAAIKWVLNPIGEFIAQQSRELKNLLKIANMNGALQL